MAKGKRSAILVIEGDEFIRRAIETYCAGFAPTVSVATFTAALDALEGFDGIDRDLLAVVMGMQPGDGSGSIALDEIRRRHPEIPVLIRVVRITCNIARLAARHRAELLGQFDTLSRLDQFIARAVSARGASRSRLSVAEVHTCQQASIPGTMRSGSR